MSRVTCHMSRVTVCHMSRVKYEPGSNWAQNMIKHIKGVAQEEIIINLVKWFEGHNNKQLEDLESPRIFKSQ